MNKRPAESLTKSRVELVQAEMSIVVVVVIAQQVLHGALQQVVLKMLLHGDLQIKRCTLNNQGILGTFQDLLLKLLHLEIRQPHKLALSYKSNCLLFHF